MPDLPKKLQSKLAARAKDNALRKLPVISNLVDFSSNDYLGFAKDENIHDSALNLLSESGQVQNGATGSRLLSGNHPLYEKLEGRLAEIFETESALVFNSGYDANVGFFSAVPQRGDIIFYDEFIHASIRDGIKLGNAEGHKFKHNDLKDLTQKITLLLRTDLGYRQGGSGSNETEIYIVTESVFSMDGDSPDLKALARYCKTNNYCLVVDEAHAIGVLGPKGTGLCQELGIHNQVFIRIITFGKALGCHGAAVLGNTALVDYLINFCRSFIYTTGLPPHSVASILTTFEFLSSSNESRKALQDNITFFNNEVKKLNLGQLFIPSSTAVHCCVLPGNKYVVSVAKKLRKEGFNVMPIRYPSVRAGQERLRLCLHSSNTKEEISQVLKLLAKFI